MDIILKFLLSLVVIICLFEYNSVALLSSAEIEVLQTEATVNYHSKKHEECLRILKQIIENDPNNINALELQALTYKELSKLDLAYASYEKLLLHGDLEKKPAYHFELGAISFKEKNIPNARRHLSIAANYGFNPGMSHFFLGMIAFDAKAWRASIHHFFTALTSSDVQSLDKVIRYYLANAYVQIGQSNSALREYKEVTQEDAQSQNETLLTLTRDVKKNALKELAAFDQSQSFINLSYLTQWDSNVQTNPSLVYDPDVLRTQRTLKSTLSAFISYSTSPVKNFQIIPSYRYYGNYNYNRFSRDYNFMTHTVGSYFLYKPYSKLVFGLKGEGNFSQKNNLLTDEPRSRIKYESYSLTGDVGPVVKYAIHPKVNSSLEVSYRPKKFFLDPASGPTRRTGVGVFTRLTAEIISGLDWFNPIIYGTYEWDFTDGLTYRMHTFGGGISDTIYFSERLSVTPAFDVTNSDYYKTVAPSDRNDWYTSSRLAGSYILNSHWSLSADVSWIRNNSTQSLSYTYTRIVSSIGAGYTF